MAYRVLNVILLLSQTILTEQLAGKHILWSRHLKTLCKNIKTNILINETWWKKDIFLQDTTSRLKGHCGVHDCVSVWVKMLMSEHYLVLGGAEAWKCSRVPPLTRTHFKPQALIPFKPAQALTWDHMFGESTSALLCYVQGERDENILPASLPPAIGSVIKSSCEHKWEISEWEEKKKTTCTHRTISPALPSREGKSTLHKADMCHSDSSQIVDYCFD